jgi:ATP-binding cassette subfamily C exporter for protease/lipase
MSEWARQRVKKAVKKGENLCSCSVPAQFVVMRDSHSCELPRNRGGGLPRQSLRLLLGNRNAPRGTAARQGRRVFKKASTMRRKAYIPDVMSQHLLAVRGAFWSVGLLSGAVNFAVLVGALFVVQVYDGVLVAGSKPMLWAFLLLVLGFFGVMGLLDYFRARILGRVAAALETRLAPLVFRSWIQRTQSGYRPGYRPLQDLSAVQRFLSGARAVTLFDLPWVPLHLVALFVLHVQLGLFALGALVLLTVLGLFTELLCGFSLSRASQEDRIESRFAEQSQSNADTILAMGMLNDVAQVWRGARLRALVSLQSGTDLAALFATLSRTVRIMAQIGLVALAALLVLEQRVTPGVIAGALMLGAQILSPMDQAISGWVILKQSRLSYIRLKDYLGRAAPERPNQSAGSIAYRRGVEVEGLVKFAPRRAYTEAKPLLSGISFLLEPGSGLGVIGSSGAGKTVLARLLVGLWTADRGRLDINGVAVADLGMQGRARDIGFLPQQVTLMSGTIAQNICRFDPAPDRVAMAEAAQLAGIHGLILSLPEGYETEIDSALTPLTGGQVQRIGLARAVYGSPGLVVLDEPATNLDPEGNDVLTWLVTTMRASARRAALAGVDQLAILEAGQMVAFGPKAVLFDQIGHNA